PSPESVTGTSAPTASASSREPTAAAGLKWPRHASPAARSTADRSPWYESTAPESPTSAAARRVTAVPTGASTTPDPSGRSAGCSPVYAGGTTWICGDGRPSSGTSRGGGATATACQPVSPSWAVTRNEKLCGSRSASIRAATSTALGFFGSAPAASG